ncbi:hypothetical protein TRM7557_03248 [Tritonibacter multivorans]|uniref:Transporter family-2 protein n=1 Tax=Tritonibacter multivorans TaxID=928856 RepID=A0A0P1GYN5_9RHOB|nr:DMT family transporter [Tritonibacter multivorans]MDA7420692.1 DMT family transporter [Tritonibacter multivorans]CUH81118.1 hypothetical protein TRM7557_03248 [Tritonibacter multivorans]SFC28649.1 transporter family-2 protein [Tritonibacter multivorans]
MTHYALTMLAAGIGIPILAALNARLGSVTGSPALASIVLFLVALSIALVFYLTVGPRDLSALAKAPKHLFLAGCFIAFYVLTVTHIAPHFGVGNSVFFVLIGQLIAAAAIDHFGLFGAQVSPLTLMRAAGISVMAVGVWITQMA